MGTIDDRTLGAIKRRFPGREVDIDRAFQASRPFRALCKDYLMCAAALERCQRSASGDAPIREAEYAELLAELAKELESHLDGGAGPGAHRHAGARGRNQ